MYSQPRPGTTGYLVGRLQRQVRWTFIINDGRPITTTQIPKRAYPRQNRYSATLRRSVREAASRYAVPLSAATGKG
jgi:hypothetical protein